MKKLFLLLFVFFILASSFVMAGGDKEEGKEGATGSPTELKGTLSVWLGYGETIEAFNAIEDRFKLKYPNIKIEILTFALHEFEAKLASAMPTGAGPDIMAIHDYLFQRYYANDYLEPLPQDLSKVVNDPKIINPTYKDVVTRDGVSYTVPWWAGRRGLFYNIDHFNEAGLDGPPQTVDEFWSFAEKLTKKNSDGKITRAGATLRLTGPSGGLQKWTDFYYQMSGHQTIEAGDELGNVKITLEDNINIAAEALMDHVNHLHGAKKVDDWSLKHDAQGFASGVASMLMRESWAISFIEENGPDINFDVAYIPADQYNGAFNYIETLGVSSESKLKPAAWDYIRMLQSQDVLDIIIGDAGYTPLRKDRDFSEFLNENPRYKAVMTTPEDRNYQQYLEPPNVAYEEMTIRMGEVLQNGYRDANLVNNLEGCRKVIREMQKVGEQVARENGILAE